MIFSGRCYHCWWWNKVISDGFFSGIVTAVGDASFSGNVSVGGTLTYEDVTNIDAVGLLMPIWYCSW